jgi:hypothetical protein
MVMVIPAFTSRSPVLGSSAPVDGIVSLKTPLGRVIVLEPPLLSAAWIAARNVQLPPFVEEHDVPAGLLRAASVVSLTVKVVEALDGCEKASIPGTAIAAVIVSTAKSFEAVRRPHRVASERLLDNDIRFPPQ